MSSDTHLEILDLRHFSAAQLGPLLRDEAAEWQQRLRWDYSKAISLLLEYIDGRILPGFVALDHKRIAGYTFAVLEAGKAVVGDVYAFNEIDAPTRPVSRTLLMHLLEMLEATPGVDRIESQLLMFTAGAFDEPFRDNGFHAIRRLFMLAELTERTALFASALVDNLTLTSWRPELQDPAARLIHSAYEGHMDASINDQYRSVVAAHRFLHNIIRFPGCGLFDPENSWALRVPGTANLAALLLTSRVRFDTSHITQLCVSPGYRNRGLGAALLSHAVTNLLARGISHLSLTVTEGNDSAIRLYERHRFQTTHRFEAMIWDRERG